MLPFPHHYGVTAVADPHRDVTIDSNALPTIRSAPPAEFSGPGDRWSPETLLVAAVADCFILTFRGIARASHLPWVSLHCDVEGTLDRVDRITRFTKFVLHVQLDVEHGTDVEQAQRLLTKAEDTCLVTRSLNAESHLDAHVEVLGVAATTA